MPQLRTVPASPSTRSEERRRKLLVAAADLFLASGYDGVSMDAIVAEAGIASGPGTGLADDPR